MPDNQAEEPLLAGRDQGTAADDTGDELVYGTERVPNSRHCRLYISHFLSTWNARQFEFAVTLLLLDVFPNTLRWTGIFGFCTTIAAIIASSSIGNLANSTGRLRMMQFTILLQRFAVCCAALTLLSMLIVPQGYKWIGLSCLSASRLWRDSVP